MKTLLTILLLTLSTTTLFSQIEISHDFGDFEEIKVYDLIQVNLIQSKNNKVVITGENKDDVNITNNGKILKVKMNINQIFDGNKTKVTIYYKSFKTLDANEGANITSSDVVKQENLTLKTQEGAKINIPFNVDNVTIKAISGGIVEGTGEADNQTVEISTGGAYHGKSVTTENTKVNIKAGGEANIYATQSVVAKVKAGGNIYIYGNPKEIIKNKLFGGSIIKK